MRLNLAQALRCPSDLLLLDEPLSALDANVRARLRLELLALQRRVGVTALMVTHDQQEALAVADRIIVMNRGRIVQCGTPRQVFETPADLFVARFMGEMNAFPITGVDDDGVAAGPVQLPLAEASGSLPARAHLCIRPSAVLIGAEAAPRPLAARVRQVLYLGDTVRLTLQVGGHEATPVDAEIPSARLPLLPSIGDEVSVAFPAGQVRILGDGA
jgi:iron(III) transport system ATP-binding protein